MRAFVCTKYGSPEVLQLKEVAKHAPKYDEALIKILAASINSREWRLMSADSFFIRLTVGGFLRHKTPILGADMSGHVEAVGVRSLVPYGDDDKGKKATGNL